MKTDHELEVERKLDEILGDLSLCKEILGAFEGLALGVGIAWIIVILNNWLS